MNPLRDKIIRKIEKSGPICFADFMDMALYEPGLGYYQTQKEKIGKKGDFFTAPHLSSIFGKTVARHFLKNFELLTFDAIVEFGAGYGWLAKDINDYLAEHEISVDYIIIEKSGFLAEKQKSLLSGYKNIHWAGNEPGLANRCCYVIANEFLDALLVHRLQKDEKTAELKVGYENDRFTDKMSAPCKKVIDFIGRYVGEIPDDIYFEANTASIEWLETLHGSMDSGLVTIIDYGYTNDELALYPNGTVTAFKEHKTAESVFDNIGSRDITAYVNFSALMKKASELEFGKEYYGTQSKFLLASGILEEMEQSSGGLNTLERFNLGNQVKGLIMPNAMGERFKVLSLSKG